MCTETSGFLTLRTWRAPNEGASFDGSGNLSIWKLGCEARSAWPQKSMQVDSSNTCVGLDANCFHCIAGDVRCGTLQDDASVQVCHLHRPHSLYVDLPVAPSLMPWPVMTRSWLQHLIDIKPMTFQMHSCRSCGNARRCIEVEGSNGTPWQTSFRLDSTKPLRGPSICE